MALLIKTPVAQVIAICFREESWNFPLAGAAAWLLKLAGYLLCGAGSLPGACPVDYSCSVGCSAENYGATGRNKQPLYPGAGKEVNFSP